jgi:hypothetical protein
VKSEEVGIFELFPPCALPYGLGRVLVGLVLDSNDGVLLIAGLTGPAPVEDNVPVFDEGADRLGLLPANIDSDGFFDHGNMLVLGIFHPD